MLQAKGGYLGGGGFRGPQISMTLLTWGEGVAR